MNGIKWRNLKERLGFNRMGCCGPISSPSTTVDHDHDHDPGPQAADPRVENIRSPLLLGPPSSGMMNLAMALAAERNQAEGQGAVKTLMRLIEETDGVDWNLAKKRKMPGRDGAGDDWVCCVCIDRSKGAAFIPCGHAFCRVCSRALWASRGSCPICNRPILQILDIF